MSVEIVTQCAKHWVPFLFDVVEIVRLIILGKVKILQIYGSMFCLRVKHVMRVLIRINLQLSSCIS